MTQVPPTDSPNSFLRLHRGSATGEAVSRSLNVGDEARNGNGTHARLDTPIATPSPSLSETDNALMDQLWDRFGDATGWKLAASSRRMLDGVALVPAINTSSDDVMGSVLTDHELESISEQELDKIEDSFIESFRHHAAVGRAVASDLASTALEIAKRLASARKTIRRNQAELAARASVIATPEAQDSLDKRLETILSDVVMACGCDAAVIYTLDDDTSNLSARTVFGMSPSVIDKPPRGLESSRTDVETMVRSVVMIDSVHATTLDTWNTPEECAAGICAVINSGDVPIGTLWLFSNQTQTFTNADSAAARMAARAIGVELTFAVAPSEDTTGKLSRLRSENRVSPTPVFSDSTTDVEIQIDDWEIDSGKAFDFDGLKQEVADEIERELTAEDSDAERMFTNRQAVSKEAMDQDDSGAALTPSSCVEPIPLEPPPVEPPVINPHKVNSLRVDPATPDNTKPLNARHHGTPNDGSDRRRLTSGKLTSKEPATRKPTPSDAHRDRSGKKRLGGNQSHSEGPRTNLPGVRGGQTEPTVLNPVRAVAQWQYQTLPVGAEIAPGWKADGMIDSPSDHAVGWHTWDVLPDGMMAIAMAESIDLTIKGTMNATVARAALASHAGYRHTPDQLLARVGDTLWQTGLGEQLVSLLYACIDPETGEGEIASAGAIHAIIGSPYGYRPLVVGDSDPLCMHIDTRSRRASFRMMTGEALLAYSPGLLLGDLNHTRIGGILHTAMRKAPKSPLASIHRHVTAQLGTRERGAMTLVRS